MTSVAIIGLGNFGTALARTWLVHGHRVSGWTVEQDVHDSIKSTGINQKYLDNVSLEGLRVSMDFEEALRGADVVVLALPSGVVLDVVDNLAPSLSEGQVLLDVAKGLAPGDRLLSDVIEERLRSRNLSNPVAILVGPTIAPELATGVVTTALIASEDADLVGRLVADLTTSTLRLQRGTDPRGAELWGAFKNVIAVVCGISDGLPEGGGDNLKAAVFSSGYREACRLLVELGAHPDTALGPAGIGDLFVTATSPYGRNRSLGERLGSGMSLEEALGATVMVSEGVRAARMFGELARARGIDTPFVDNVNRLLDGEVGVQECIRSLLAAE